jgi:nitrite reductase/ring-hydroxylating ferredoxin subunit
LQNHPQLAFGCRASEIAEGSVRRIERATESLLLLRNGGLLRCYVNRCPHQGTELDWAPGSFLDVSRRYIQCSTHGALFEPATGQCVSGPCVGAFLETVEISLDSGNVYLSPEL